MNRRSTRPAGISASPMAKSAPPVQLTIFTPLSSGVIEKLREADLDRITPIAALNLLHELKRQIE